MYISTKTLPMKGSPEKDIMRPVTIPIFIEKQWEQIRVNIPPPPSLDNTDTPCSWRERKKRIDDALSWLRTELSNLKIQDQQILGQFRRCQDTIDNLKSQKTHPWSDWDLTSEDDLEEDEGHWEDWEIKEFEQEFDKSIKDCKNLEKQCLDLETSFEKRQHSPSLSSSSSRLSDKHSRYFHHKYSESESSSTSGHSSLIRQDVERRKKPTRHTMASTTADILRQSPELAKRILNPENGTYTSRLRLGIKPSPVTMTPVRVTSASMTQSYTSPNITSLNMTPAADLRDASSPSSSWVYSTVRRPSKATTSSGLTSPTGLSERTFSPFSALSSPTSSSFSSPPFSPTPSEPNPPHSYNPIPVPYSPTSSEPRSPPAYNTHTYSPRSAPIINPAGSFRSPLHAPPSYSHFTRTPSKSGVHSPGTTYTSTYQNRNPLPTHRNPYSPRSAPVKPTGYAHSATFPDRNPFTYPPPPVFTDL